MKTNLDKIYKTNRNMELEGNEFYVAKGVFFRMRRFGGSNANRVSQAMAKFHRPHLKKMNAGTLSPEEIDLVDAQVLTEACIVSWGGVRDEQDKEIPFTFEACTKMLSGMPDLLRSLLQYAQDYSNFREEGEAGVEELGNSSATSSPGASSGQENSTNGNE